jgi:hypothetical protein
LDRCTLVGISVPIWRLLVLCPVTMEFSGSLGKARARKGTIGKKRELVYAGGVVQLVRTPACHAGGRGSSPVAPAKILCDESNLFGGAHAYEIR